MPTISSCNKNIKWLFIFVNNSTQRSKMKIQSNQTIIQWNIKISKDELGLVDKKSKESSGGAYKSVVENLWHPRVACSRFPMRDWQLLISYNNLEKYFLGESKSWWKLNLKQAWNQHTYLEGILTDLIRFNRFD